MRLPIVLRPEAEADLLQAHHWYEQEGSELAEAFADSLDEMIDRIEAMPELYAVALKNIRRGKLRKFPYLVYYRVLPDRVEVIGVLHGSREPHLWHGRTAN